MNLKSKKGSISIFVLIMVLFMSAFLIISFAANINKSKVAKEQFNIISDIYSGNGDEYNEVFDNLREDNKKTITTSSVSNTLELNNTFDGKLLNYRIYGNINLPDEYQEVEYIQSTGTQYIDTGFKPNQDTKVEFKFQQLVSDEYFHPIFGSRIFNAETSTGDNAFILWHTGTSAQWITEEQTNNLRFDYASGSASDEGENKFTGKIDTGVDYEVVVDGNIVKINGNEVAKYNKESFNSTNSMYIFTINPLPEASGQTPNKMRLYYFKIYDNEILVRNMIPCYRKSDDVAGLYDTVNGVFYPQVLPTTDSNYQNFGVGNDVNSTQVVNDTNDSNYGKYKIDITVSDEENKNTETVSIYLSESLKKDCYIDLKENAVIRNYYSGEQNIIQVDLPDLKTFDDYTKIEVTAGTNAISNIYAEYETYEFSEEIEGYTQLEYIQSTGTQYIDTGYRFSSSDTKLIFDFEYLSGDSGRYIPIMGQRTVDEYGTAIYNRMFAVWINNTATNTNSVALNCGTVDTGDVDGVVVSGKHTFKNINNEFYLDDVLIKGISTSSFRTDYSLTIFGVKTGSSTVETRGSCVKLYSFKIYDKQLLMHDFIPCKRNSDNVIGLYDKVSGNFYENKGTGYFLGE